MIFDPDDEEHEKIEYIFAVGWDKRIYIWADEKTEVVETYKMLPLNQIVTHKDDIMSTCFVQTPS